MLPAWLITSSNFNHNKKRALTWALLNKISDVFMKQYKEKVEDLKSACENDLFFVERCGNENATSDRMLEVVLDKAVEIKQEYDQDGQE